jgi:hypothetical protein
MRREQEPSAIHKSARQVTSNDFQVRKPHIAARGDTRYDFVFGTW